MNYTPIGTCDCGQPFIVGRNGQLECKRTLDGFYARYGVRYSNDPRPLP